MGRLFHHGRSFVAAAMPIWENNVTHGTHQKSMNAKSHDLDLLGVSVLSVWAFAAETASLVPVELSRLCPCSPPWWLVPFGAWFAWWLRIKGWECGRIWDDWSLPEINWFCQISHVYRLFSEVPLDLYVESKMFNCLISFVAIGMRLYSPGSAKHLIAMLKHSFLSDVDVWCREGGSSRHARLARLPKNQCNNSPSIPSSKLTSCILWFFCRFVHEVARIHIIYHINLSQCTIQYSSK